MTRKEVKVNLLSGLHARPAAKFVQLAKKFKSKISVSYNGKNADPKSIIALLSLGVQRNALIEVTADGEDEEQAVSELCTYAEQEE